MQAWVVERPGPIAGGPLRWVEIPDPVPGPGEVRLVVEACGVCRTDLHLAPAISRRDVTSSARCHDLPLGSCVPCQPARPGGR
jgi:threonine dehydrogenase-like Zn-dependent dehydrogenase